MQEIESVKKNIDALIDETAVKFFEKLDKLKAEHIEKESRIFGYK